ncbi:peptidylprolyl isomerase [Qipengyuania aquimaris]|uniref:peptidylprolyl isomerase n=1 Tax=Qipengyuania aquimaris TaxID=255984 RepID=UPI001C97D9D4|nr:peptidylprolyl isomerase [Qipengyuania aquimaris]MBY6129623.1 peptidylprolyl isomerase [Qipengyuania aquimaris]
MTKHLISLAAALALAAPLAAQDENSRSSSEAVAQTNIPAPSPNQIVEQAEAEEWVPIAPEDLLVMTLAPDAEGTERKVMIQLLPAPFSEAWTANIRTFARSGWYDDITVNRVQDNYVAQWGDANYDNPESDGPPKELPQGLLETDEVNYTSSNGEITDVLMQAYGEETVRRIVREGNSSQEHAVRSSLRDSMPHDPYASGGSFFTLGWPMASEGRKLESKAWPVHCYGMVGVGRNLSPDAGTGAELYTVIGHAPRHLDRNIALVGRIVEGIEHLSSLPRGKGVLGFYEDENRRTPILTVRVASDLPEGERPAFEYLDTEGETFAAYADARANRRDPFFNVPAGGADICNIPVPVRRVAE